MLPCRKTAEIVVDIFLKDKGVVGLGNGPFAAQVIECIAERRKLLPAQSFQFVPATDTAAAEAAMQGLPVTELAPDSQVNHPDLLPLIRVSRDDFSAAPSFRYKFQRYRLQMCRDPAPYLLRTTSAHEDPEVRLVACEGRCEHIGS